MAIIALFPISASCLETISGRITKTASGLPLPGIDLDVFLDGGGRVAITGGVSDIGGNYTLTLPGPGVYIIRADAAQGMGVADEYFNNVFLRSQAQTLVVGPGQALANIDFALEAGVTIGGVVREASSGLPLSLVDMDLFASNGEFLGSYPATTAPDGTYVFGDLPPGDYFVAADPDAAAGQLFVKTFFGGQPTLATATAVTVGTSDVIGIDIDLQPGGAISGVISDGTTSALLVDIDLDVFDALGARVSVNAATDINGAYTIGAMPAGDYFIRADPTLAQGYPRTYFPNAGRQVAATLVSVVSGAQTTGVNFALVLGGSVSGRVSDTSTSAGLPGLDLDVFDSLGVRVSVNAVTGTNGLYFIGPLAVGDFVIRVDPTFAQGYPVTYFPVAHRIQDAQLVSVAAGSATANIDFNLPLGGTVSGLVREAGTGTVQPGMDLDCFNAAGARIEATALTDVGGAYVLGPLAPGTYFLRADPTLLQGFADQFYSGQSDINFADAITVSGGVDTSNIDFDLAGAGSISGTVFDSGLIPLAGIDLDLFDAGTGQRLRTGASSAIDGTYSFESLAAGNYKVRADPNLAQGLQMTYFSGKGTLATADVVTVTSGSAATNTDFLLSIGASISGRVLDGRTGGGIPGIDMDLLEANTFVRLDQGASTDGLGDYTLAGLPPGEYVVRADPAPGKFFPRTYFGGASTAASATPIVVNVGENLLGRDIVMFTTLPAARLLGLVLIVLALFSAGMFILLSGRQTGPGR